MRRLALGIAAVALTPIAPRIATPPANAAETSATVKVRQCSQLGVAAPSPVRSIYSAKRRTMSPVGDSERYTILTATFAELPEECAALGTRRVSFHQVMEKENRPFANHGYNNPIVRSSNIRRFTVSNAGGDVTEHVRNKYPYTCENSPSHRDGKRYLGIVLTERWNATDSRYAAKSTIKQRMNYPQC